jgi:hypothetical protein
VARDCICDRCKRGKPWTQDQCWLCWLYHNNADYRAMWDNGPAIDVRQPRPDSRTRFRTCRHKGRALRGPDGKPLLRELV